MPQRAQVWNSAVRVPNAYLEMSEGSLTTTFSAPPGLDVHAPPCLVQNEQVQARTGISAGSGSQVREKEMFPQWHLPWINKGAISIVAAPNAGSCRASEAAPGDQLQHHVRRKRMVSGAATELRALLADQSITPHDSSM